MFCIWEQLKVRVCCISVQLFFSLHSRYMHIVLCCSFIVSSKREVKIKESVYGSSVFDAWMLSFLS